MITRALLGSIAYFMGSEIISRATAVIASIFVARWLGPEELGRFSIVRDIGVVAVPLFTLGMSQVITREIARLRGGSNERAAIEHVLSAVLGLLIVAALLGPACLVLLSGPAEELLGVEGLAGLIRLLALVVLVSIPYELVNALTLGFEEFRAIAMRQVAAAILNPALIIGGVYVFGVEGAVVASGGANLILLILLATFLWRRTLAGYRVRRGPAARATASRIAAKGLPLLGSILLMRPLNLIGGSTLVLYASVTDLGWFRVAYTLYGLALIVPSALQIMFLPVMAKLGDDEQVGRAGLRLVRLAVSIAMPAFVLAILVAESLVRFVFGVAYAPAAPVAGFMFAVGFGATVVALLETNVLSQGKTGRLLRINIVNATVFIAASQILIPALGYWGLAGTYFLTEVVAVSIYFFLFWKSIGKDETRWVLGSFVAASGAIGLAVAIALSGPATWLPGSLLLAMSIVLGFVLMGAREREVVKNLVRAR